VRESWQRRVLRAEALMVPGTASVELVAFYAALLRAQRDVYDHLSDLPNWRPSGSLERDLPALKIELPAVLTIVAGAAPESLADEAKKLLETRDGTLDELLCAFWQAPSDRAFFAKAIVQPYADRLAATGVAPIGRDLPRAENRCPFCRGTPQLSILRSASDPTLEGGGRALQCATCLTIWPFRRVVCAHCGEEDERKLGYFQSTLDALSSTLSGGEGAPPFDHVRVEACDTCGHYLKGIDLTRLGIAVPLVDEVASAPLDAWAREHGYTKIELNLIGL
jgi:formate dehydrogenase accessory protein FdhE